MGAGIALLLARHGLDVRLLGRSAASVDRALGRVRAGLKFLGREGALDPAQGEAALARVRGATEERAVLARSDLVIEAVSEDADVKRATYEKIGAHTPPDALVASTTSGLDIFDLVPAFPSPQRLLIAHFWNPAYLVPLVEVVPGPATSGEAVAEIEALLRSWERVPVRLQRYVPGFIGVRMNSALYREALHLIDEGVTDARGIDAVMRESIALRFPVLDLMEVADFGGLDTFSRVWDHSFPALASSNDAGPTVRRAVGKGALGLKAGRGFHEWHGRSAAELIEERDRRLLRWLRERARYRLQGTSEAGMRRRKIAGPEFGFRTGAFSNAYVVDLGTAEAIYTAGHLAVDSVGNLMGGPDTARQAEFIYGVIERILTTAGASLDDVVKTTAYLTDIRDYPAVNEIRNRIFAGREPASTIVEVSKLVHPGAKIEIEAVAIRHRQT
jgi:3-hydroxybutyryl-CoA dehydrogenase